MKVGFISLFSMVLMCFSLLGCIIYSYNPILIGSFSKLLAPPFDDELLSVNLYGQAYYGYDFSLSDGELDAFAKAVKGFGSLRSSSQVVLSIVKTWTVDFNGKIVGLEVTYSLKGYMVVQVSANSNVYGGASKVHLSLKFGDQIFTLEDKRLEQYGTGYREYYYRVTNEVKSFKLQRQVSRGDKITIIASLIVSAEVYGAIEDYSFANSDFYLGGFGAGFEIKVSYLEDTTISASVSKEKVYLGDTIKIDGRLTSSTGIPLADKRIDFFFDGRYVDSTFTLNDGSFTFYYTIPDTVTPGTKTLTFKFNGDNSYTASQTSTSILIPSFSINSYTSGIKIPVGGSRSLKIYVYDVNGYDRNVKIVLDNVPSWLKIRFIGSNENVPPFNVALSLKAMDSGFVRIGIIGVGDDGQRKVFYLSVRAYDQPSFEVYVSPISQSVLQGASTTFNVSIVPINDYRGIVNLDLISFGANFSYSFSENPVIINSKATSTIELLIYTSLSTLPGNYTFKVLGYDSSLQVESNDFSLKVEPLPKPSLRIYASPKNQTIIAGNLAYYNINITSLNGFEGYVYLNLSLPEGFNSSFNLNPVYLSKGEVAVVNLTIATSEIIESGFYNFTVAGYGKGSIDYDWIGLTVISYPAKLDFFYVNWISKKWFYESTFLPLEVVGVVVRYEPYHQVVLEFPREIVSPYYENVISLLTNASGIATTIIPLNGPVSSFGFHRITVKNSAGEVIGEGVIEIDGVKVDYRVKNCYGYSIAYFYLKWASSNNLVLNRNGTLELEFYFPNGFSLRSPPVMNNGSIIFYPPRIDMDAIIFGHLLYSGTNQWVYVNSSSPSITEVRFRSIASYLIRKECVDFNFNLEFKVYYRYTLEPADNVTVRLLVLDGRGGIIFSLEKNTDNLGLVRFSFSLPFKKSLSIKILCLDRNTSWVTCSVWADLHVSREHLSVLTSLLKDSSLLIVKLASMCGLMDLHCKVTIEVYDRAESLQYVLTQSILIQHGIPLVITIPVSKLRVYYVRVKVVFNGVVIGEIFDVV